tara:strand:- start:2439 stop:2846 length:408 start_codon:yes stop_codon:yes gene_type:complete
MSKVKKGMMRRTLFTILSLVIATTIIAQTTISTEASRSADWNETFQRWDWHGAWQEVKIDFLLQGNVVLVRDNANSTYTMLGDSKELDEAFVWDAIDEKHLKCSFMMTGQPDENNYYYILVMYDDVLFKYAYQKR